MHLNYPGGKKLAFGVAHGGIENCQACFHAFQKCPSILASQTPLKGNLGRRQLLIRMLNAKRGFSVNAIVL